MLSTDSLIFDDALDLFGDVVDAVVAAHSMDSPITHRDIKPDNVVVSDKRAYLIDFGLCQWEEGGFFSTIGSEAFGNRSFAAPECELGSNVKPNTSSDIYSLGKLLYWMVSGGRFFARENLDAAAIERIPQPRSVERTFITRLLRQTAAEEQSQRLSAAELGERLSRDAALMRTGTNAVGSANQLCPTCRIGHLEPLNQIHSLGFNVAGNMPEDVRMLHCDHCGYLQHHLITRTESQRQGLWDISQL